MSAQVINTIPLESVDDIFSIFAPSPLTECALLDLFDVGSNSITFIASRRRRRLNSHTVTFNIHMRHPQNTA